MTPSERRIAELEAAIAVKDAALEAAHIALIEVQYQNVMIKALEKLVEDAVRKIEQALKPFAGGAR